jgi:hypothetical protein
MDCVVGSQVSGRVTAVTFRCLIRPLNATSVRCPLFPSFCLFPLLMLFQTIYRSRAVGSVVPLLLQGFFLPSIESKTSRKGAGPGIVVCIFTFAGTSRGKCFASSPSIPANWVKRFPIANGEVRLTSLIQNIGSTDKEGKRHHYNLARLSAILVSGDDYRILDVPVAFWLEGRQPYCLQGFSCLSRA